MRITNMESVHSLARSTQMALLNYFVYNGNPRAIMSEAEASEGEAAIELEIFDKRYKITFTEIGERSNNAIIYQ